MTDTTMTEPGVLPAATELPQVNITLTAAEIFKQLETYRNNADASLGKLQQGVEKYTEQLNQLQRMRLELMAQRALTVDLLNKITGTSANTSQQ